MRAGLYILIIAVAAGCGSGGDVMDSGKPKSDGGPGGECVNDLDCDQTDRCVDRKCVPKDGDGGRDAGMDSSFGDARDDGSHPPDASHDASTDSGADGSYDASPDTGYDGGFDAGFDAGFKCGPSTCADGCCDTSGTCLAGGYDTACGTGGVACINCMTSDKICFDKACETCGTATCQQGCCNSNGRCVDGTSSGGCGTGGIACIDCFKDHPEARYCLGKTCAACSPQTCPDGCCDTGGYCVSGKEDAACGKGGAQCADCSGSGRLCTKQECKDKCAPANCPDGCCGTGNVCEPGTGDNACGDGGADCIDCDPGFLQRTCQNRVCRCDKTTCGNHGWYNCCDRATDQCIDGTYPQHCANYGNDCKNCWDLPGSYTCEQGECKPM